MTSISAQPSPHTRKKRVQKLITFSPQLARYIEFKAEKMGVSFPEYIRALAMNDIKDQVDDIIVASPEMERQIGLAMQEVDQGHVSYLDPSNQDELDQLFGDK